MAKVSIVKWITNKIKQAMAIVQDGDTATRTISSGKYVLWNNNMYTANSNIASGDDLSSKLTACADGGLNELSANTTQAIAELSGKIGNLNYKVIENVTFTFSNSNTASKAISNIDSTLANAKYISGFSPNGATTVELTRNQAKTNINAVIGTATTGDVSFNILCIW